VSGRLDEQALVRELDALLADADAELARDYPGDAPGRQPVHTVYVPADRYHADIVPEWGTSAHDALAAHGAGPETLASVLRMDKNTVGDVLPLVLDKLEAEPIEDLRIDFEDGLGAVSDREEDDLAVRAAEGFAVSRESGTAPPWAGIRVKSLEAATRARSVRTLDLFVGALASAGKLPDGLVVTLPKVTSMVQVEAMVRICERLENAHALDSGRLRFEVQIETPQAILGADGTATVARIIHAASGRLAGLHYGTYDYSAALGVAAAYQSLDHPAADYAKAAMQVAAAGTGVRLSDGSTNVLPVGGSASVHAAWRLHARLVRRSLERGFYQGWDLHPAQLPTRFLATFAFYLAGAREASARLSAWENTAGRVAGGNGGVLDEPATAQALAAFLLRAVDCGALRVEEIGIDEPTLRAFSERRQPVR
jgi:citrate lyase beta subunit